MIVTLEAPSATHRPTVAGGMTPEEFALLPRDDGYQELVDGIVIRKPMSKLAHLVASNLIRILVPWAERTGAGSYFPETEFRYLPGRRTVRKPDGAFFRRDRFAGETWEGAFLTLAPDLTIEIISPSDVFYDVDRKLAEFFEAGVRRVWIINPDVPSVRVHRAFTDVTVLRPGDELVDEEILPGFRCPVAAVFARPGQDVAPAAAIGVRGES